MNGHQQPGQARNGTGQEEDRLAPGSARVAAVLALSTHLNFLNWPVRAALPPVIHNGTAALTLTIL